MRRLSRLALLLAFVRPLSAQTVTIDSTAHEIVISVGALDIPALTPYDHHDSPAPLDFSWPATGWVRGYRLELVDSLGKVLPREMLHHAGVANLDRRQLLYPMAERLFAVGKETDDVMLPGSMGVPLSANQHLLLYFALVNPTDREVRGATLRLSVAWRPEREGAPRAVLPIAIDASPVVGRTSTFLVPPGQYTIASEFTLPVAGHIRELGGHLHDHGVELRLEDAESGKVLAKLAAKRFDDGRLREVERTRFLFRLRGLPLKANHRYRVVGVYENPTCTAITGAMAGLGGVFEPDDIRAWPAVDTAHADYRADLAWLRAQGAGMGAHHEEGAMDSSAEQHGTCVDPLRKP
jgi:hypothetical protein